ncbi:hypothetical protein KL936_001056 [Ogataea polymorpha]|nr:hypothetical protein KL936_001056 [Ogataea polymorpha]
MDSARPKRKTTVNVNYKEKSELDLVQEQEREANVIKKPAKKSEPSKPDTPTKLAGKNKSQDKSQYVPVDEVVPTNFQPKCDQDFNVLLDLKGAKVENNVLTLKDGTRIKKGDFIYMICEPPGEPYYIARIKGFVRKEKDDATKSAKNYNFEVCWFYRPRDLNRKSPDSRLLFASLHMDECPISSFRGFVTVKHRAEIEDLDAYRMIPHSFYFEKLYDRYMVKMYDVLPTIKLTNLPPNYYKALTKRFEYIFVEVGRGQDLLSDPKNCEKCMQWAASSDSIQCLRCQKIYHLLCVDPPITSKPKRGFAWFCAACNKELEEELSEKRGHMLHSGLPSQIAASIKDEDSDVSEDVSSSQTPMEAESRSESIQTNETELPNSKLARYEELAVAFLEADKNLSFEKRREIEEWPYRYLGMHAKLEDALDLQDRPYPRAASRLGTKHQFTGIVDWYGHPVVYYDDSDYPKARNRKKNTKKKTALQTEEGCGSFPMPKKYRDCDPSDLPKWLQPKPKGYIERGTDATSELLWKQPENDDGMVEKYLDDAKPFVERLGMIPTTPNFIDAALRTLMHNDYNPEKALQEVSKFTRDSLKEPTFTPEEIQRFEESVKINGSELFPVFKDVKTQSSAMIVRFYYLWKKTKNGHLIWDNYAGRPKNRLTKLAKADGVDVNDPVDDSSYSTEKIERNNVTFECKHCHTRASKKWFKLSGTTLPESYEQVFPGLCLRCARLWREYGVEWEDPYEIMRKQSQRGGNGWKRKIEFELYEDARKIIKARDEYQLRPRKYTDFDKKSDTSRRSKSKIKEEIDASEDPLEDKLKKKSIKVKKPPRPETVQKQSLTVTLPYSEVRKGEEVLNLKKRSSEEAPEKKNKKQKPAPLESRYESKFDIPLPKFQLKGEKQYKPPFANDTRACCVCREYGMAQEILICTSCGLNVHASCYGDINMESLTDLSSYKWLCDTCSNDLHPLYSTDYKCVLCPAKETDIQGGKLGFPYSYPDALKRTASGNWCHIICATFDPYCEFGSTSLQPVFGTELSLLKNTGKECTICGFGGSLLDCKVCQKPMHVTCCLDTEGCAVGFELVPDRTLNLKLKDVNRSLRPVPQIVCCSHLSPDLVSLRAFGKMKGKKEQPLIKLYCTELKQNKSTVTGEYWHRLCNESLKLIGRNTPRVDLPVPVTHECLHCHNTRSLRWYEEAGSQGEVCHQCYVRKKNDESLIDVLPDVQSLNRVALNATKFGLIGLDDKLKDSRMSIKDMLS